MFFKSLQPSNGVDSIKRKTIITRFLLVLFISKGEIVPFVQLSILMAFGAEQVGLELSLQPVADLPCVKSKTNVARNKNKDGELRG